MTHPHNANPADYAAALEASARLCLAAASTEAAVYAVIFNSIEVTEARADAIAARRAVFDALRACHAAMDAIHAAKRKAEARTTTLAAIEAGKK
jgi:hypothetical protein